MSGSKCEERRECGEMGSVKKEGDSVKKGKCDNKGEQKPYIQFLRTAHFYSDEHTVVVILLIKFRNGTNRLPLFPLFLRRFKYGKS